MPIPKQLYMRNFAAVDLETTSVDTNDTHIVEFGCKVFSFGDGIIIPEDNFSSLHNPGIPIPPESSSAHNIRDEDVSHLPLYTVFIDDFIKSLSNKIWVIHNADFDFNILYVKRPLLFGPNSGPSVVIDTLRFSRKLLKDNLTSFNLGTLFHYYKLSRDSKPTHRAGDDCNTLYKVFLHLCNDYYTLYPESTFNEMLEYIYTPYVIDKMSFGKHKGSSLDKLPTDYLSWWLYKRISDPDEDKPIITYSFAEEMLRRYPEPSMQATSAKKKRDESLSAIMNLSYPIRFGATI